MNRRPQKEQIGQFDQSNDSRAVRRLAAATCLAGLALVPFSDEGDLVRSKTLPVQAIADDVAAENVDSNMPGDFALAAPEPAVMTPAAPVEVGGLTSAVHSAAAALDSAEVQQFENVALVQGRYGGSDYHIAIGNDQTKFATAPIDGGAKTVGEYSSVMDDFAMANANYFGACPTGLVGHYIASDVVHGSAHPDADALVGVWPDGGVVFGLAGDLLDQGLESAVTGRVHLIKNGEIDYDNEPELTTDPTLTANHPRTAIGVDGMGNSYLIVVDGRSDMSRGENAADLAEFGLGLGLVDMTLMDGGGSSTLVFGGGQADSSETLVNTPSDGQQRRVCGAIALTAN